MHGLYLKGWTLALQAARLRRCAFRTHLFSYASWYHGLDHNAARLARFAASLPTPRLHFVGHSLGGLVILRMLQQYPDPRAGRVVLLGSPYVDSAPARALARTGHGRLLLGRSMLDWLNGERPDLGDRHELGVVAGCRSLGTGRLVSPLPPPNDGVVAEVETRIPGARDSVLIPVGHAEMLWSVEVARQCCAFLREGHFIHAGSPEVS